MARVWSRVGGALALVILTACASQPSPQERIEATEQATLASLKAQYPDIVTAFDIDGNTLNIAIDANGYIQTADPTVDAFKKKAGQQWRAAWIAAHPHQHALLTVRLTDFMSRVWDTQHVRA
jgi:hypothetical protein